MKPCFVSPILAEAAKELGIEILIEPRYGYVGRVKLPNGAVRFFRSTVFDLNGAGATEIAKDKDYASFFLKESSYPIPKGEAFHTDHWAKAIDSDRTRDKAWSYAQTIGLPVIVKPNSKSQGSGVAKVWNKQEFDQAITNCSKGERVFLVQTPIVGHDYRIVVLDHEVISAYERLPLSVTGDGMSTIEQLLEHKQVEFEHLGRDTQINFNDPRLKTELLHQELTLSSVLKSGRIIRLLSNANLSTGGDAIDVTSSIHDEWKILAIKIAHDMNLRYIGIDIMTTTSFDQAPAEYVVLEINAAPGLDNYASIGETQTQIVKALYKKVLLAMME